MLTGSSSTVFPLLDSLPIGVMVLAPDMTVHFWNSILTDWTGVACEQIKGQQITDMYPEMGAIRYTARLIPVFEGGPPVYFSAQLHPHLIPSLRADGKKRILQTMVTPVLINNEYFAMASFQDVTDLMLTVKESRRLHKLAIREIEHRKTVEAGLHIAQQLADSANKAKSEFLATMSHELRTPLNAIIGFTDVLQTKKFGAMNEEQDEFLGYVMESSLHLLSLINDILDLSKIEAGKMQLDLVDLNIRDLLSGSLVMVQERAINNDIKLKEHIAENIPLLVKADERKLKQVLYNLLSNAVKFTPNGGAVSLIAAISDAGSELLIRVEDSGIGLKKSDLEQIFKPFIQADDSAERKYEGTGLGLSLTRELVQMHGGTIHAESEGTGKGSSFVVKIPL